MRSFYDDFGFIISFLFLGIGINMTLGQKFLDYFLMLVLLSMAILNSNKLVNFLNLHFLAVSGPKRNTTAATH